MNKAYEVGVMFSYESGVVTTPLSYYACTRNYELNRNGNSANFFSHVCNGKKIKELFPSTLNKITASVRCVSSIMIVINAKLTRLTAAHASKNPQ